jgi:hypothetical protein
MLRKTDSNNYTPHTMNNDRCEIEKYTGNFVGVFFELLPSEKAIEKGLWLWKSTRLHGLWPDRSCIRCTSGANVGPERVLVGVRKTLNWLYHLKHVHCPIHLLYDKQSPVQDTYTSSQYLYLLCPRISLTNEVGGCCRSFQRVLKKVFVKSLPFLEVDGKPAASY